MSKHNYSQYSNKDNTNVDETVVEETAVVEETVVDVAPVAEVASEKKSTKPTAKSETAKGIVTGCMKLNVRVKPNVNAEPVCVVDAKSELKIDKSKSNKDWFYVCTTTGVEGYCMRKFVEVNR